MSAIEPDGPLTLYLIICLACVSALFLATAVATMVVKVWQARWSQAEALPMVPKAAMESNVGSLPRSYVHDVCFAAGTVNIEFQFLSFLLASPPGCLPAWANSRVRCACNSWPALGKKVTGLHR